MASVATRVVAPRALRKAVKGTNIVVEKVATDGVSEPNLVALYAIEADDAVEAAWFRRVLRHEKNLTHPSEAFLQGIKALRPAMEFNTFDLEKSHMRRLVKQLKDRKKAARRRAKEVGPTAAMKAALNPHKVPRGGGPETRVKDDVTRMLARSRDAKAVATATFRKAKARRSGKAHYLAGTAASDAAGAASRPKRERAATVADGRPSKRPRGERIGVRM